MRLKSRRAAHLLVSTAAVLATLTACGPPSNLPHVTMVGDSTLAGMVWYDQAGVTRSQDVVRAAYDLTLDAESCRRLVAPSCRGRFGYVPNTTMDVLRANRGRLGEAVVIMGGYDDISIGDAVPQILAETEAQGVKHVIWLDLPAQRAVRAAERLPGPQPVRQPQPGAVPQLDQPPDAPPGRLEHLQRRPPGVVREPTAST